MKTQPMPRALSLLSAGFTIAGAALAAACGSDPISPNATVRFVLDAPFCSSRLPVQFFIDAQLVATDTFAVNFGPAHTVSALFSTKSGVHSIGARVVNGFIWPDKTITLTPGQAFNDTLPFYCS